MLVNYNSFQNCLTKKQIQLNFTIISKLHTCNWSLLKSEIRYNVYDKYYMIHSTCSNNILYIWVISKNSSRDYQTMVVSILSFGRLQFDFCILNHIFDDICYVYIYCEIFHVSFWYWFNPTSFHWINSI